MGDRQASGIGSIRRKKLTERGRVSRQKEERHLTKNDCGAAHKGCRILGSALERQTVDWIRCQGCLQWFHVECARKISSEFDYNGMFFCCQRRNGNGMTRSAATESDHGGRRRADHSPELGYTSENELRADCRLRSKCCIHNYENTIKFDPIWVQCDDCSRWYHVFCIRMKNEVFGEDEEFSCCKNPSAEVEKAKMGLVYAQFLEERQPEQRTGRPY